MTILMAEFKRAKHCASSVLGAQPKGSKINAFSVNESDVGSVNESDVGSVDEPAQAVRMTFHRTLYFCIFFCY
jgi:hypothetical protein